MDQKSSPQIPQGKPQGRRMVDLPRRRGPYLPSHSRHKHRIEGPWLKTLPAKLSPTTHRSEGWIKPSPACLKSYPFPSHIRADPQVGAGSPPPPLRTAGPARGGTEPAWLPAPPPPAHLAGGPGRPRRPRLLPRLTHLEGEGGGREAAEPRGPGVGRSRG